MDSRTSKTSEFGHEYIMIMVDDLWGLICSGDDTDSERASILSVCKPFFYHCGFTADGISIAGDAPIASVEVLTYNLGQLDAYIHRRRMWVATGSDDDEGPVYLGFTLAIPQ